MLLLFSMLSCNLVDKGIFLQLSKCGSAPIVSCATVISENILFLGSWLGDSLLAKFTRHQRIDKNEEAEQPDVQGVDDVNAESLDSEALDDDQVCHRTEMQI